jgi:hypothetical protein
MRNLSMRCWPCGNSMTTRRPSRPQARCVARRSTPPFRPFLWLGSRYRDSLVECPTPRAVTMPAVQSARPCGITYRCRARCLIRSRCAIDLNATDEGSTTQGKTLVFVTQEKIIVPPRQVGGSPSTRDRAAFIPLCMVHNRGGTRRKRRILVFKLYLQRIDTIR